MLPLMPMPAKIQPGAGRFLIDSSFAITLKGHDEPRLASAQARFLASLSRRTGISFTSNGARRANVTFNCAGPGQENPSLGEDESYRLEVTPTAVRLDAPTPLGLLHGMQTFLQLVQVGPDGATVPAVIIEDRPRFPWRGLLIDVSRHFIPVEVLKRNLDAMEAVKLNVLHWHLSDDQGFRVESKKFPRLQEMASDGKYYTQVEIRDLIQYARDRGIRVVPEFDMPGHFTSWLPAYPELASAPGPYQIERHFGVFDPALDPAREESYKFLDGFIGEMAALFPDAYFHIGGDEVNGKQWDKNPGIQDFMRQHGFKTNHDLQAYFNQRLEQIVKKHGKIMDGWDEILHPGLPTDTVVQSWRGQKSLAEAARSGYAGLLSSGYYIDLMYPAARHYLVDPLAAETAGLSPQEQAKVLGGEACMWAEFVTAENIDGRIWPRTAAIAERFWSPAEVRDVDQMYTRLNVLSKYLEDLGLRHNAYYWETLQRLSGGKNTQALQTLADVLEPVKGYVRHRNKEYTSATPLDRLVDAVHPESETARVFGGMVDGFLKDPSATKVAGLQHWLTIWHDNGRELGPVVQSNPLLKEIAPLSQNLDDVTAAGLQALGYMNAGGSAPAAWREQQLSLLKQAEKPQAEMLNMIVPSVRKLVEATTPR
ncbi:MAG TPA: family 20 glycosylhydrolase [Verrucomicrobiae bacterium]|nr:family 20 glycosylhydrolase [Verrucomicrobiae bacterium]